MKISRAILNGNLDIKAFVASSEDEEVMLEANLLTDWANYAKACGFDVDGLVVESYARRFKLILDEQGLARIDNTGKL